MDYSIADGCHSFANNSDKSQTKATTNSNNTTKKYEEYTPKSGRKRGSKCKMPSQDLEESPSVRAQMNQHPNPMSSKDLHYIDSDSDVHSPSE